MTELAARVRFLHLVASVLLVGRFAFACFILRGYPSLALVTQHEKLQARLTAFYLTIAFITHLAALILQASLVNATDVQAVLSFVTSTRYGSVWLTRLILLCLLALVGRLAGGKTAAALLLSAAHLATLSLSGHAAAAEGSAFALQTSADALHLLATGIWLGGLLPLAHLLSRASAADDDKAFSLLQTSVQRFSNWALLCAVLIVVTGSANAWNLVGGFPQLFGSEYGRLLLGKLALLLPLLAVAARNLRRVKPSLSAPIASNGQFIESVLRLRRNVLLETTLGMAILLIVGHLGVTPPARHVQPDWPFPFRWDWSVLDKSAKARAEFDRGVVWAVVGAGALLCPLLRRRRRTVTTLIGVSALGYAGYVVNDLVVIDAYPTTYKRPGVSYNAISVANGGALYHESGCVSCHGVNGYGDGPNAQDLNPKPVDLTAAHANAHTAGDLYWWLSYGVKPTSAMPGFSESLSEEERWDLINYLRALSSSKRARGLAPLIEEKPWLVAPDFAYTTDKGESRTLRDHRGNKIVLLVLLNLPSAERRLRELAIAMPQLSATGVEVVVVPNSIDRQFVTGKLPGAIVDEGIREIGETYKLFARSFTVEDIAAVAPHVEYLVDKQGYVRARWLPSEGEGWRKLELLMKQIDALQQEKPSAPAPDEHVH
ncbi:MAG: c-type cytochrome [Deltaproteobacteria bacterium]|nr:c-type cytochrome [Deltaproteobacteria bacterium]